MSAFVTISSAILLPMPTFGRCRRQRVIGNVSDSAGIVHKQHCVVCLIFSKCSQFIDERLFVRNRMCHRQVEGDAFDAVTASSHVTRQTVTSHRCLTSLARSSNAGTFVAVKRNAESSPAHTVNCFTIAAPRPRLAPVTMHRSRRLFMIVICSFDLFTRRKIFNVERVI